VTSLPVIVAGIPSVKKLQSSFSGSQLNLSWPAPSTGFVLQQAAQFGSSSIWTNSSGPFTTNDGLISVSMEATNPASFFRLRLN
jgi:hypothetical protein